MALTWRALSLRRCPRLLWNPIPPLRGEVEGLTAGKVYPIGLIDVNDRCLRFIGKPRTYICLKEGCTKHQGEQLGVKGRQWFVLNTTGNGFINLVLPEETLSEGLKAQWEPSRKTLEDWNRLFEYVRRLEAPVTIKAMEEREAEAEAASRGTCPFRSCRAHVLETYELRELPRNTSLPTHQKLPQIDEYVLHKSFCAQVCQLRLSVYFLYLNLVGF